ncbi:MAG: MCE family protein [Deltaproteobacteria bacterium]|nr:MCE family protein [Deltaproteobacteria bacterium]
MNKASALKVGLFALVCLALIVFLSLRVSDLKFSGAGHYPLYIDMKSAEGVDHKTPVLVAGIQVGIVEKIELTEAHHARLTLRINKEVQLPQDVTVEIRRRGVLSDVYLELVPGFSHETIQEGQTIVNASPGVDFNDLAKNLNEVAINLKEVSSSIKGYVSSDDSALAKIMKNMEHLTADLAAFSGNNRQNLDVVVANLKDLTGGLKGMVNQNAGEVNSAIAKIESITRKIDSGKGSLGKLINDSSTVEKVNEALDSVNDLVSPVTKMQTELGYHLEYLGHSNSYKNYVSLALRPRPDKAFLLEFVSDSNPRPNLSTTTTTVTSGGVSNTVVADQQSVSHNSFRISAELAKRFYDFTLRAGIIESSGGVGLDYDKGPFGVQLSAFGFNGGSFDRPHLKASASVNVTKNIYLLGGADDFISKHKEADWFVGAGVRFLDDDIKSLLGAFSLKR